MTRHPRVRAEYVRSGSPAGSMGGLSWLMDEGLYDWVALRRARTASIAHAERSNGLGHVDDCGQARLVLDLGKAQTRISLV